MGKCYPPAKLPAGAVQGVAHIPQKEESDRRYAIRMSRHAALANIDLPIRKKLAQMIVGPAVAEPQLEHMTLDAPHQSSRQIEARALGFEPANKAVQPAHRRSGSDTGLGAQAPDLGKSAAELPVCSF